MFQLITVVVGILICAAAVVMAAKRELWFSPEPRLRRFAPSASVVCVGLVFVAAGMFVVPLFNPPPPPTGNVRPLDGQIGLTMNLHPRDVAAKSYTQQEFRPLVLGKSEAEVKAQLGSPRKTSTNAEGATIWHYKGVVTEVELIKENDVAFLADPDTQLVFADGKVENVVFNLPKVK